MMARMNLCAHCGAMMAPPSRAPEPINRRAIRLLAADLDGAPEDCWRFFAMLFDDDTKPSRVKGLAYYLAVDPSTLVSRFYRAGLPSPKQYMQFAGFVRAARCLEDERVSIHRAAEVLLGKASSQSFHREVRLALGMSAQQFRRAYTGETMLERFRQELVLPHRSTLLEFRPMIGHPERRGVRRSA